MRPQGRRHVQVLVVVTGWGYDQVLVAVTRRGYDQVLVVVTGRGYDDHGDGDRLRRRPVFEDQSPFDEVLSDEAVGLIWGRPGHQHRR